MKKAPRQQQSRTIETRQKLIYAALDVIYDVGFTAATTEKFSERAKVSRGALLHHFPTRADIIIAAMEQQLEDGTNNIRSVADEVAAGRITVDEFVDFLWRMFSGRFFYLSLEMITEARTDYELRSKMLPVVKQFHNALDSIWLQYCGKSNWGEPEKARVALNLTICLLRGMGLQTVLRPDVQYYKELLEAWKALLPAALGRPLEIAIDAK